MRKAAIITYAVGIGSNLDRDQLDVIAGVPENLMMLDNFSKLDNLRTTLPGRVCAGATSEQILIRILITSTRFDVSLLNANSTAFQTLFYQINTAFLGYFPGVPGFTAPLVSLAPGPTGDSVVAMCLGWVPAFASNTVRSGLLTAPAQLNNLTIDTTFTSVVAAPGTSVVFARLVVNVNYTAEYQVRGSAAYDALIIQLQYQVLNQFSAMQGTVDIVSLRVTQILPGSTATTTTVDVEVVTTASQVSSVQGRLTNITAPGQILGGATVISSQVALTAPVCSVRVDLVFVLDGTGSVGADNFEIMKTFVQKMISDFEIGSEATRIGVVVYSHRAELAISLDAFEDVGALQDAVAAIAYPGGYTRTGAAIDYTTTSAFSTRNGAREGVVRVAIILTDGISYDDPSEPAQSMRKAAIITYAVGIGSNLDRDQLDVIAGVPENLMMLDNFSKLDNLRTTLPGRVCAGATSEQILIRILITSTRFDVSLLNANSTAFQTILYQINTASASVLDLHATLLLDVMDVTTFLASFQFLGYFPGVPGFTAPLVSLAPGPTGDSVVAMCLGWVPAFASNTVRSGLLTAPAQLNNLTIDTTFTSVVAAPGTSVVFARLVVNVNYTAEYQVRGSAAYDALIIQLQYEVLNQFSAMQGTVDIVSLRVTQILPGSTATTTTVDVEVVTTASQVSSVQGRLTNITAPGQTLGGATVISSQVALTAPVCSVRVDLVFVLDGTGSVGADNFEIMKTFVQKMISDFEIGSEATRIGVVVYSHRAELAISLDAFEDVGALQDAVAAIAYPGGYTRTGAAIDYTTTSAFSTRNGAREGVVRVAIILTDGISYDDPSEPAQSMRKAAIITYAVGIGSNLDRDQLDVIAGVPENLMMLDNFSKLDNLRTTLPGRVCAGATSEQILIRILITSTRFDVSLLNANSTAFQTILYQINTASASVLDLHATLLLDVMDVTTFLASFQFLGYFPGVPGFTAPLVSLAPGPTGDSVVAMCLGWVPAFASNTVRSGLLTAPAQLNNLTIDTTFTSVVAAPGTSVVFARLVVNVNYTAEYQVRGSAAYDALIIQLQYEVLNQFSAMQGTVDIVSLRVTQILPGSTATTTTVDVEVVTTASQVSSVQGRLTNITAPGQTLGGATVISSQVALTAPVCSVRVDLVFVLDGTGSVGADNFEIMKTFVQKMISDFEIGSEATRIGVVVYSHRAELAISLDAFEDVGALQDAVAAIAYPGGYTRTGAAIDYTTTSAFSTRNGAREGVVRVAIILTDGISYDDPSEPAQSMRKAAIITYAVGIGSNLDRDQLDVIAGVPENLMMLDNFSKLDNLRTTLPGRVCAGATSEQILIRILITSTRFDVSLLNANSTAFQTILYQINTASASVLDLHATLLLDVMDVTTFLASFQFLGYFPGVPGFTAPLVSLAPGPTGDSVVAMCLGWVPAFASNTVRSGLLTAPAQLNNLTIDTTFTSVVAAPGTSVVFARLVVNVNYTAEYQVRGSAAYDALILQLQYQVLNQFSAMQGTVDIVSLRVTQILPGSTATTTTVDVEVVTTASQVSSVQGRLTNITAPGQTLGGATVISSQVALTAPVCSVRVDLVFVLDGTGSVGADNFEIMKTFVQKMISDFEIGSEATRIGVVVYSHRAELAISLDAFEDVGALQDAVAAIAYPGGYTRTGAAIDYTTTSAFSTRNGAREGVVRVAIILTDGISYDDPSEPAQSMRKAAIITYAVGIGSNLDRDQLDVIAGVPENLMMLDNFSKLDNLRTTLPGRVCAGATSEQILIRILITSTRFDVSLLNANSTAFQTILYQINTASASVLDLHATLLLDVMDVTTFLASFQFLGYFPGVPGFTAPLVSLAPGPTGDSVVAMCLGWVPAFASNTVRSGLLTAPAQLNNLTIDTTFTSVVAAPGTSVVFARLVVNVNYTAEYQVRGSAAYDALILQLQYQVLNQFSAMQGTVDIVSLRVTQILPGSTATTTTVDVEVVTTASQVSSVQGRLTNITAPGQILGGAATVISSQVALTAPVCSVRVDLVFVLDGTGSVGADNFEIMKTFVQKMISDFEIGSEATRIGVLAISLDAFEDVGALQDAVAAIAYPGGYTRTGAAIDYTTTSAFSTRNGAREGVVRVAIILTDGISYDDPSEPAQSMRKAAIITYAVGIGSNLDRDQLDVIAGVPENLMMLDNFSMLDNLRTTLPGRVCAGATSEQILIRILITSTRFDVSLLNANSTAFQTILYQINTASASVLDLHATLLLDVMDVTTFLASFQFLGYFPGVPGFTAPLVSLAPGPTGDSVVAMCLGWVPAFASNTVRSGLLTAPAQLNNLTIDTTFTSVVAAPGTSVVFARLVVNVNYTAEYQVRGSAAYDALIIQLQYQVLNQFSAMQGTVDIVSLRVTQILPGSTATTTTVDVEVVTTASQVSSVQGRLTNITAPGQILGGATVISSQVALTAPVCSVRVDLVFVLDGTGSVGADNFEIMKTFVQKMISDFEIGSEATRIGVVVYSHRAELAISLDAFEDVGALQDAVAAIAYPGGYTRTGAAIDYTTTSAFSTRNGAREGVVRVAIILTDGISYDDPSEPAQSMRKAAIITYAVGIGSNLDRDQLDVIAGVPENLMMLDNFSMLDNLRTTLPGRVCAGATSEQILIRILITSTRFDVSLLNANSTAFQTILYQINTASASVLDLHATLLLDVMDVTTFLASFQFLGYFPGVPGFTAPLVSLAPGPTGDSVVAMCLGWVPAFASNTVRSGLLTAPAQLNNLTIDTTFTSVVAAPGTSVVFARLVVNVNYTAEYQVRGSAAYDALILQLQYQVLNQFSAMQGTVDIVSLRVTQILPGSTATTTTVDVEVVTTASQVSSVQGRLTNITAPGQILGGATVISSQVALTAPVCSVRVDLVFVLDGTGSVGADNFEIMKTFVQKMISDFEIGSEATRIGVVVYSHRAELAISLDAFEDGGALQDAVAAIAYPGGYTRTGAAIDYTTTSAFSTRNGAREGVVRVAIILTDGISYDDPSEPAQSMRKAAIITYAVGIGSNLDRDQLDVIAGVPENLMMLDNFSMLDNLRTTLPGRVCAGATSEQILIRILITSTRFDVSLLNANSTAFQTILYQINTASASVLDLHATLLLDVMDVTTFLASFQFLGYFPGVPGFTAPLVSLAPGPTGDSVVAMCLGWVPAFASNTVRSGLLTAPAQLNNLTIDTTFTSVVAAPGTSVVFARLVVNVNYTAEYQVRGSAAYDALILQLQYQVLNQFSAMQGTVDIVSLRVTQILPGSTATTTTVDVEVVTTASQVSSVQGRLTNITAPGQILAPVCSVRVDLVFVLDGTGSVGADNFEIMKTFVQKMISDFEIGSEATRIGVVVYSHRAELAISLDAFEDVGALQDAVAAIAYPGGYTRTGAAIDYTTTSAFSTRNGAREGVVRVAIILTDGISYDDPSEPAQSMRKAAIITYAVGIGSNLDRDQLDVIAGVPENLMMLDNFSMLDNLRTTLPGRVCAGATTSEQILIRILITSTRFDVSLLNANSTAFQTILYQINTASASVLDLHATLLLDVMDVTTFLASFQFLGYFPGVPGFTAPLVSLAPGPTGDSVVAMCLGWVPAFASNTVRSGLLTAPAQLNNLTIDTTFTSVVAAPGTSVVFARLVVNVNYTAEYQVRGSAAYDALILQLQYQVLNQFSAMQGTVDIVSLRVTQILPGSTATTTTVDVEVVTTASQVSSVQGRLTNITAPGQILGDFEIGSEATRIGVVVYSHRAELAISLDAFEDGGALQDASLPSHTRAVTLEQEQPSTTPPRLLSPQETVLEKESSE
ncbi:biological adhesion [Branchiostoma belcheri]|nr:biological adhesion [Branchiostoma belcheri]